MLCPLNLVDAIHKLALIWTLMVRFLSEILLLQRLIQGTMSSTKQIKVFNMDYNDGGNAMDSSIIPNQEGTTTTEAGDDQNERPPRKTQLSEQEWHTMANFAKAQGRDLMKQVEDQKKFRLAEQEAAHALSPNTTAKYEKDKMRRILDEKKPRASEEYLENIPTESERDTSPGRVPRRRRHHYHRHHHDPSETGKDTTDYESYGHTSRANKDPATSEINGDPISLVNEEPSTILQWLRGYGGGETEKRIILSEDRIMSLLQAFQEGTSLQKPKNWVPLERLREAERRSSAAEEQIRHFEQIFNVGEGSESGGEEEQLRSVLTKSKTMDHHFAHMKKFAEDRHADVRRTYSSLSDRDVKIWRANSASRIGMVSPEKAKKELQEHENHKKRLVQVFTNYNELLRLVKVEHARRVEAENKTYQLASQLKRQTATLKRAEKVIKHTALSPIMFNESHSLNSRSAPHDNANYETNPSTILQAPSSPSHMSSYGFASSAPSTPRHHSKSFNGNIGKASNSKSGSPVLMSGHNHQMISKHLSYDLAVDQPSSREISPPHSRYSTSDLIADNHSKEFQEIEDALIEEGRSKGFGDVDLYTEKKTVGKEETCWEYRHVHFDFNKAGNAERSANLDVVSNQPNPGRRTPSPGRSEGSSFTTDEKRDLHEPTSTNERDSHDLDLDDDCHLLSSAQSIASYREGQVKLNQQDETDHQSGAAQGDSHLPITNSRSPLKLSIGSPCPKLADGASPRSPTKVAETSSSPRSPLKLDPEVFSIPEIKMAEERNRIRALEAPQKKAEEVAVLPRDDVAASGRGERRSDVATSDDMAASKENDVAASRRDEHRSDVDDLAVLNVHDMASHTNLLHSHDKRLKYVQPSKSSFNLQRRVAAIEARNVAHMLHRQVKQRRRLLLIQVVVFATACLWGLSPISWQSSLPPT
ncbi:hypothetical protein GOP47_0022936 [Adiantum capillus-veneris]|uniref:Uncharacterized protein n=1 Tax=Adiantum capillus-veneris TaxID=13818 RepID=A0A9D4U7F6_ADICA|nr:hypothetical protein GOP47_0022936 [Adiantum capillus-veneris]